MASNDSNAVPVGRFSPAMPHFCAMHLGCNLRKAFLQGIKHTHM